MEVWDSDPQATAIAWADLAADPDTPLPFEVEIVNYSRLDRQRKRVTADYVVLDTPPGDSTMIDAAIVAADLVILPTVATAMDLEHTIQTAATIPTATPRAGLITRTNKQTRSYRDALEFLSDREDLAAVIAGITNREAIHHSYGSRPPIFHEYSAVTDEILETLP